MTGAGRPNARVLGGGRADAATATPVRSALIVSIVVHAIALALVGMVAARITAQDQTTPHVAQQAVQITWIAQNSPPGDVTGGSGHKQPAPARPMERPGTDAVAVPTRPSSSPARVDKPAIPEPLDIPALPTTAGIHDSLGVITTVTSNAVDSDGPGSGDRQGSGDGSGPGPGRGSGPGGDGYRPGNGVTSPRLVREVKPGYTGEAMRARIQGTVRLQAIVLPDGSVGNMKIIRSLDHTFGLDDEALKSVSQWRFQPGTLAGRAVPVLIEVELAFTLR